MRPYSHHLIVTIAKELPKDVVLGEPVHCDQADAVGSRWLLGSQDPQIDLEVEGNAPGSLPAAPGDPEFGLGQKIMPNTLLRLDLHYVNTTDKDILREGWVYLAATPKEKVLQEIDMITMFQGAIEVPPFSKGTKTARGRCSVPSERYVGMVTGHFHKNGTRFSVWYEPAGGTPTLVYETKDWDLPGNAWFTQRITNPTFDGSSVWGATTGYLKVKPGDFISFECEFDNPTDSVINFGELGRDQMCNVFGFYYPSATGEDVGAARVRVNYVSESCMFCSLARPRACFDSSLARPRGCVDDGLSGFARSVWRRWRRQPEGAGR